MQKAHRPGRDSNPRPFAPRSDALPIDPLDQLHKSGKKLFRASISSLAQLNKTFYYSFVLLLFITYNLIQQKSQIGPFLYQFGLHIYLIGFFYDCSVSLLGKKSIGKTALQPSVTKKSVNPFMADCIWGRIVRPWTLILSDAFLVSHTKARAIKLLLI